MGGPDEDEGVLAIVAVVGELRTKERRCIRAWRGQGDFRDGLRQHIEVRQSARRERGRNEEGRGSLERRLKRAAGHLEEEATSVAAGRCTLENLATDEALCWILRASIRAPQVHGGGGGEARLKRRSMSWGRVYQTKATVGAVGARMTV